MVKMSPEIGVETRRKNRSHIRRDLVGFFSTRFRPRDGGRLAVSIRVFGFNPKPLMKKYPVDFIGTLFPVFTVGTPFKFINPDDQ